MSEGMPWFLDSVKEGQGPMHNQLAGMSLPNELVLQLENAKQMWFTVRAEVGGLRNGGRFRPESRRAS